MVKTFVDIRGQDRDTHLPTFRNILDNLLRVLRLTGEQGRHEFDREVDLEIGGLVSKKGVGSAVGFVETIPAEGFICSKIFSAFLAEILFFFVPSRNFSFCLSISRHPF